MKQRVYDAIIGMADPLEVYAEVVRLEKQVAEWKDMLLESAINQFEKHGSKSVKAFGYEISLTASGRYSYDGYEGWTKKKEEMKDIEAKMQIASKMRQPYVDSTTGEEYPCAEYKPNKTSLSFKALK